MTPLRKMPSAESLIVPFPTDQWVTIGQIALFATLALVPLAVVTSRVQFAQGCLVAFGATATLGLGGLFFMLLHHVVGARWSVAASRHMRGVAALLPWSILFLLPVLIWGQGLEPWMRLARAPLELHSQPAHSWYNHPSLVLARTAFCWLVWSLLARFYARDALIGSEPTSSYNRQLRRCSGPALVLVAFTLTSFGFDWFMLLQPGWHSSVFGVYLFAGAVPSALAVLALATLGFEMLGIAPRSNALDARHDIAKLLFGFVVFWAYIAFSQYLLIWYADIPAETSFYRLRLVPGWRGVTLWLIVLHFAVPFAGLLSARAKRSGVMLGTVALSVLLAHILDYFWLVMPALGHRGAHFRFEELVAASLVVTSTSLLMTQQLARESRLLRTEPSEADESSPQELERTVA